MDIARTRQLLNSIPARSDYEFRNFEIESQGSWHRQMRYALGQKEELEDEGLVVDGCSSGVDDGAEVEIAVGKRFQGRVQGFQGRRAIEISISGIKVGLVGTVLGSRLSEVVASIEPKAVGSLPLGIAKNVPWNPG